jgi:SAM-dependent methyltransferase
MLRRGVGAVVADAVRLPVRGGWADALVANAMLYHLSDMDAGLDEFARALADDGRLVATTFSEAHLKEIWDLLGAPPVVLPFSAENGEEILRRRFDEVEVRSGGGVVTFPDSGELRSYVGATMLRSHLVDRVPGFEGPFQARSAFAVFVARRARRD